MKKSMMAALAIVMGLTFGTVMLAQADEKASAPAAAPATGGAAPAEKKEMTGDKTTADKKPAEKKDTKKKAK